jgi:hypothetical protein
MESSLPSSFLSNVYLMFYIGIEAVVQFKGIIKDRKTINDIVTGMKQLLVDKSCTTVEVNFMKKIENIK